VGRFEVIGKKTEDIIGDESEAGKECGFGEINLWGIIGFEN
jgi:hypothetical protein